jgi:hypothetical protein
MVYVDGEDDGSSEMRNGVPRFTGMRDERATSGFGSERVCTSSLENRTST